MTSAFFQAFLPVFLGCLCTALSTLSVTMVFMVPRMIRNNRRMLAAEARARDLEVLLAKRMLEDRTVPTVRRVTGPL